MKYFISLIVFTIIVTAQPNSITSFDDMMTSLKSGHNVNVVIHYAKTKLIMDGEESEAPDAIGGMHINTFEYFAKGTVRNEKAFLSCSETVLINHPFYGYVFNYAKLRIYDDNSIEIIAQYVDPKTYEIKMDEKFISEIKNENNDAGVYLFLN